MYNNNNTFHFLLFVHFKLDLMKILLNKLEQLKAFIIVINYYYCFSFLFFFFVHFKLDLMKTTLFRIIQSFYCYYVIIFCSYFYFSVHFKLDLMKKTCGLLTKLGGEKQ